MACPEMRLSDRLLGRAAWRRWGIHASRMSHHSTVTSLAPLTQKSMRGTVHLGSHSAFDKVECNLLTAATPITVLPPLEVRNRGVWSTSVSYVMAGRARSKNTSSADWLSPRLAIGSEYTWKAGEESRCRRPRLRKTRWIGTARHAQCDGSPCRTVLVPTEGGLR